MKDKKQKEPGHYVGVGVAIGAGIGSALGVAMGNIAIGVAMGVSIGVAIGAGLEESAKKRGEVRELTKEEYTKRDRLSWILFAVGLTTAILFALLYIFLTSA